MKAVIIQHLLQRKKMTTNSVIVVGAGLAGSEAAYQLAKRGVNVKL